ncbi:MAG: hypothetical protein ACI8ZM_001753 [Crocinitomix sp.]|jgi:hypothetical protein
MKKLTVFFKITLCLLLISCNKAELKEPFPTKINQNLEYFGYALVDVGWDDPTDSESKTNYIDEVHSFSNVADILVVDPTDDIVDRMNVFNQNDVKAILHLSEVFFEQKSAGGNKSGFVYGLREDYQQRWDTLVSTNNLSINHTLINCFYIGEEPSWNSIPEEEFKAACDYAKLTVPEIPILSIEAFYDIDNIYTPNSVDWVGFDHYFIQEPSSDSDFLNEYNTMKSKIKSHQKIILIMDAHWIKILHGSAGISKKDMDFVARDYYNLANSDTTIIGILGYFWPSGFDSDKAIGTRHLPNNVLDEHMRIGKTITEK